MSGFERGSELANILSRKAYAPAGTQAGETRTACGEWHASCPASCPLSMLLAEFSGVYVVEVAVSIISRVKLEEML